MKSNAVHVTLYTQNGGPLPISKQAYGKLIKTVEDLAKSYDGLLVSVVSE